MNEEQYYQLCRCCDDLLEAEDLTLARVAVPWLHVLNEHPANLSQYEGLFTRSHSSALSSLKQAIRGILKLRPRFKREEHWHGEMVLPERADIVIVSHLLNKSQLGVSEDFYFGELPQELKSRGLMTVVALRDHTGLDLQRLPEQWSSYCAPRILFSKSLGWLSEFRLQRIMKKESRALRGLTHKAVTSLARKICETASEQANAPSSLASLRLFYQVQKLMQRLRPSAIVVTFEGHAWERIVYAAARSVDPSIRCVGYQHTILFPRQHAIKRPIGKIYEPNIICTGGQVTCNALGTYSKTTTVPVVSVGTHRQENPPTVLEEKFSLKGSPACLVIPDGTMQECLTILDFVLAAAQEAPDINFIVRMHPVMPIELVMRNDARLRSLPKNIEISEKSIKDDFQRCRWAIYRGSGAAIRAVVAGLRPFYFRPTGEQLGIDPLFELNSWRVIVGKVEDFLNQIRLDLTTNPEVLISDLEKPKEFCMQYFIPIDFQKFHQGIMGREISP